MEEEYDLQVDQEIGNRQKLALALELEKVMDRNEHSGNRCEVGNVPV